MTQAAILDIDGTLVDTNYQHALAWYRAFVAHGVLLPVWKIHRHIGMGGDQIISALAGDDVESERGDDIRDSEKDEYQRLIDEVRPFEGARTLIEDLKTRELTVVLASSAKEDEVDHYLELLDARELADSWTTSADVENTKPEPDLVLAALEAAGTREAVMVGDTTWDVQAAKRSGIETIAVMSGGFGADELQAEGAALIVESVRELRERLDESPLAR
jgi:HAD superfamily hydrolase (TIGR01549 family)